MRLMQQNQVAEIKPSFEGSSDKKVRRQMLIALTLLLAALVLILTKDREFWFPSASVLQSQSEPLEEAVPAPTAQSEGASTATPPAAAAPLKAKHTPTTARPKPAVASAPTSRAVLPPLQIEVVAGDEHRPVQGDSSSVKVDLQPREPATRAQAASAERASDSTWWHQRRRASPSFSRRCWDCFTFSFAQLSSAGQTDEG